MKTDCCCDERMKRFEDTTTQFDMKASIVFNPTADLTYSNSKILMSREKRSDIWFTSFDPSKRSFNLHKEGQCPECVVPEFVRQIDESLTIDAIVQVVINRTLPVPGYLLLFNVDSKPMYCITPFDTKLSDAVSDWEMNLILKSKQIFLF